MGDAIERSLRGWRLPALAWLVFGVLAAGYDPAMPYYASLYMAGVKGWVWLAVTETIAAAERAREVPRG